MFKIMNRMSNILVRISTCFLIFIALSLYISASTAVVAAGTLDRVELLEGHIEPGATIVYTLPGLEEREKLYVYVEGTSGNLDPFVALVAGDLDLSPRVTADGTISQPVKDILTDRVNDAISRGRDPLSILPEVANEFALAWDDDSGPGNTAAFEFLVPSDGDYQLFIISTPFKKTFGDYNLLIGINEPEVLTGVAEPTGHTIAVLNRDASRINVSVQEITGEITAKNQSFYYTIKEIHHGDKFYVFAEATSGDLRPVVLLNDSSDKPLASSNFQGLQTSTELEYTFTEDGNNYLLRIFSNDATTGDYRLLLGLNEPAVLQGKLTSWGEPIVQLATPVQIGLQIDQITGVDQQNENFSMVGNIMMKWNDPWLAFNPDSCQCLVKTYSDTDFQKYVTENQLTWPQFVLTNQQGNRWSQNPTFFVEPNGNVTYYERFSTTMQAPYFDFRRYPFDTQKFFIRVDSVMPEEIYVFTPLDDYTRIGSELGEEEWVFSDFQTIISSTDDARSRFTMQIDVERHVNYYIFRILLPIVLIILVTFFTFFLQDFVKRIEITGANLLLFIAFNFTISNDLPRLSYLTILDAILITTFVISALMVMYNVVLKRLERAGNEKLIKKIDNYTIWAYPLLYIAAFILFISLFGL
jgi:hypothetical protein